MLTVKKREKETTSFGGFKLMLNSKLEPWMAVLGKVDGFLIPRLVNVYLFRVVLVIDRLKESQIKKKSSYNITCQCPFRVEFIDIENATT